MKTNRVLLPIVIGVVATLADAWLFSNLWNSFDGRRPIAEWISQQGFPRLAGWFGQFWIRIPTFAIAAVLGYLVARLFPERWLSSAVLCAVGFVGTSFVWTALVIGLQFDHPQKWSFALGAEAWHAASIGLLVVGAWLCAPGKKATAPSER